MTRNAISAPGAAAPVGPYSPGLEAGGLVFLSGQIAINSEGNVEGYTVTDQTRLALTNMMDLLKAAGLTADAVVKTTIFMLDMADFAGVNEVYGEFFKEPFPARSTVQVAALPKGVKVEIEAIAARG